MTEESIITAIPKNELIAGLAEAILPIFETSVDRMLRKKVHYPRKETKERLGVSYPTLHEWESKGILVGAKIGGKKYYTAESVDNAPQRVVSKSA